MDRCQGTIPVSAKVDRPMREFIEREAERLGVTTSEFLRRLFIVYRMSHNEQMECPECGRDQPIELSYI